ncbi:MAG: metallophosphoesterase family protein, partial [Patescibacteria group bacterium]
MRKFINILLILAIFGLLGYIAYLKFDVPEDVQNVINVVKKDENSWSFAVVGDHEGAGTVPKKIVEKINSDNDIELLINVGDLVATGEAEEFEEFLELYETLKIPWSPVLGNNDMGSVLDYDDTNYKKYISN